MALPWRLPYRAAQSERERDRTSDRLQTSGNRSEPTDDITAAYHVSEYSNGYGDLYGNDRPRAADWAAGLGLS